MEHAPFRGPVAYTGISASGNARQHNGNQITNIANNYTLMQRRSDDTLSEDARNRRFLKAAAEGQVRRVDYLRHLGADLDYSDDHGFTALHHAVLGDSDDTGEVVEVLLQAGADVNAESVDLGTPLCLAAMFGRPNIVQVLMKHRAYSGIKIVGRFNGTALHCACVSGNLDIVKALVDRGASTGCVAETYIQAINESDRPLSLDILFALLMGRRAPDAKEVLVLDGEPFMVATRLGHVHVSDFLMERGASLDQVCTVKSSVLIDRVLRAGTYRITITRYTALMAACAAGIPDLVASLLERSASDASSSGLIDAQDTRGWTALHHAASKGKVTIVQVLLDKGARVDLKAETGLTTSMIAAHYGQAGCLRILLERAPSECGVTARAGNDRFTALHFAVAGGSPTCVQVLLDRGAAKHALTKSGLTPLMLADNGDHSDCMRTLLENSRASHAQQ